MKLYLFIALVLISTQAFSALSIRNLTSEKTAKNVEKQIPDSPSHAMFDKGKHFAMIAAGQTSLVGNHRDNGENNLGFDTYYYYVASHSFDLFMNFHYSRHEKKDEWVKLPGLALGIKYKYKYFDSLSPFVLGGLGYYWPKTMRKHDGKLYESESRAVIGINIGHGLDLSLNESLKVSFLGHYHHPFKVKQEIGKDIRGSYFKLMIALSYLAW
ncbi:MAG: hypothetical protein KAQ98_05745 [Bacteriovoracaceae bacterium]|nr:hypothetical protein [Bacteriovoracaceae bacterium]